MKNIVLSVEILRWGTEQWLITVDMFDELGLRRKDTRMASDCSEALAIARFYLEMKSG